MKLFKRSARAGRMWWMSLVQAGYIIWRNVLWRFQVAFISNQLVSFGQDREVMWVSYKGGSVLMLHHPDGAWISFLKPQTACAGVNSFVLFPSFGRGSKKAFSLTLLFVKNKKNPMENTLYHFGHWNAATRLDKKTSTSAWLNYYNLSCWGIWDQCWLGLIWCVSIQNGAVFY